MLTIYKVDPPGDPLEVRLLDDLDKLIDGPLAVDVLDVAFVLLDKAVQGFGVEPHGVIHVTAVLVGMAGIKRSVVKLLLQIVPPFTNILSWKSMQENTSSCLVSVLRQGFKVVLSYS